MKTELSEIKRKNLERIAEDPIMGVTFHPIMGLFETNGLTNEELLEALPSAEFLRTAWSATMQDWDLLEKQLDKIVFPEDNAKMHDIVDHMVVDHRVGLGKIIKILEDFIRKAGSRQ